jgi:hypothetical protein
LLWEKIARIDAVVFHEEKNQPKVVLFKVGTGLERQPLDIHAARHLAIAHHHAQRIDAEPGDGPPFGSARSCLAPPRSLSASTRNTWRGRRAMA